MEIKAINETYNSREEWLRKDKDNLVREVMMYMDVLKGICDISVPESDYKGDLSEIDDYDYAQLDALECLENLPEVKYISDMAVCYGSPYKNINRRCRDFVQNLKSLRELCSKYLDRYIPLSDDEIETLRQKTLNVMGNLTSFAFFFYEIPGALVQIENKAETLELPISLLTYCDSHNIYPVAMVNKLTDLRLNYRASLAILEQYPELETPFYDAVGASIEDFAELEEILKYQDIIKIINGEYKGTIEEYLEGLYEKADK